MSYPNARDCEHGSLRRQCERCADASEIAALEARLAEVRRERDDLETSLATVAAGFEQARARAADLEAFVREPVPFGAYMRWCQDGNTADADAMQAWSDARAAALRAPGGES